MKIFILLLLFSLTSCAIYKTPEEEYLAKNRKTCMNNMNDCEQRTDSLSYFDRDGKEVNIPMQKLMVPKKKVNKEIESHNIEKKEPVEDFDLNDVKQEETASKPSPDTLEAEFGEEL